MDYDGAPRPIWVYSTLPIPTPLCRVSQDTLGKQGRVVSRGGDANADGGVNWDASDGATQVWAQPLAHGDVAVVLYCTTAPASTARGSSYRRGILVGHPGGAAGSGGPIIAQGPHAVLLGLCPEALQGSDAEALARRLR